MNQYIRHTFFLFILICEYSTYGAAKRYNIESFSIVNLKKINLKLYKTEKVKGVEKYYFKSKKDYLIINKLIQINDSAAKIYKNNKFFLVESLFKDQYSPYPENLSFKIGCPEEFFPVKQEYMNQNDWISSLQLKANNRYIYGGCTEDSNYLNAYMIFYYCKKSNILIELNYFTPISNPSIQMGELIQSCNCIN